MSNVFEKSRKKTPRFFSPKTDQPKPPTTTRCAVLHLRHRVERPQRPQGPEDPEEAQAVRGAARDEAGPGLWGSVTGDMSCVLI